MASTQSVLEGRLLERTKVIGIGAVTACPAMQIQYVGPYLYAKVAIAAGGDITFTADDIDGATTVDPVIGWAAGAQTALGIIDLSTPHASIDTYGELVDHINSYGGGNWRAFLIGALRSDLTNNSLTAISATSCKTTNGLTLMTDVAVLQTATLYKGGFAITNQKFESCPEGGLSTFRSGWTTDANCVNTLCYEEMTATQATNEDYTYFYACDDINKTETLMRTEALWVTTVMSTFGATPTPDTAYIKAPEGCRLVSCSASTTGAISALVINAIGKTQHLYGGTVPGSNYTGCV